MKKLRFFKCNHCGNVAIKLLDKNVPLFCCGQMMEELHANTTDAATEKHLPVAVVEDGFVNVKVGSLPHPMEEGHYINFIAVETTSDYTIVSLQPNTPPEAKIYVGKDKVVAVYEMCNLHGLWKSEL